MSFNLLQPRSTETPASPGPSCTRSQRAKFSDPYITAEGAPRASVPFLGFRTLWFNTGTLCNLACHNCYIESSPINDRLVFLTRNEVKQFLDEASLLADPPSEIGFTGGEPFMNPDIMGMLEDALAGGSDVLVLTNAMKPMQRRLPALFDLNERFSKRLSIRVSLDHYRAEEHEHLRGRRTWQPTIEGLRLLSARGFQIAIAGRMAWGATEAAMRDGFRALFATLGLSIDANDPSRLVLFPELEPHEDVPEISEGCWRTLAKSPRDVMCANSRMVAKRKGAGRPTVLSCTLLPYSESFEMGASLASSRQTVWLNHSHCARFCVLGGASCSSGHSEASPR
jgi:hypothetical protein